MKKISLSLIAHIATLTGILCLVLKGFTPEYVDEAGMLHEWFFLLPVGSGLLFIGIILEIVALIVKKRKADK